MSQQALRQASIRAVTSTTHNHEGDWHALFTAGGIAAGDFNGRMIQWINTRLTASHTDINSALAAFAAAESASNFQSIGTFTP
jgi:hypothetical protein